MHRWLARERPEQLCYGEENFSTHHAVVVGVREARSTPEAPTSWQTYSLAA